MLLKHSPLLLLILDGWGHLPPSPHNAITAAKTPCWDQLWKNHPHALLEASGPEVGLPVGQMGNSEVGHLTIGAGRIVDQDLTRINKAIADGSFSSNATLCEAFEFARSQKRNVHLIGLLSPGGVHSHETHLYALLQAAKAWSLDTVFVHAFLDGRDTPPRSAAESLRALEAVCQQTGGTIASLSGRYYAMDRDNRWERIEKTYTALTQAKAGYHATDALSALQMAYDRGETDEFVQPTLIQNGQTIQEGDVILFFNFRADRARELSHALHDPEFSKFPRGHWPRPGRFLTLTEYAPGLASGVLFPSPNLENTLGDYLSAQGCRQLRITETEKYAHVTFFFNGGNETPSAHEDRILIPSQKVSTYDQTPEMSLPDITKQLVTAILDQQYDFILCNFANADMVGHTGQFLPTVHAIESIDRALAQLVTAIQTVQGQLLITADHGNAECLYDEARDQAHTAHTLSKVPFLYVGPPGVRSARAEGSLKDLAPTILQCMGLAVPKEMTGVSLLVT